MSNPFITEKNNKNEQVIKDLIVKAHAAGLCDKDGNSGTDSSGHMIAVPSKIRATSIYKNGKWIKVI